MMTSEWRGPQGAANTSLKFGPQPGQSFGAGERRHRSTLYLGVTSFDRSSPSVFVVWFDIKTGDELFHQASTLDRRQAENFGLKCFKGCGHDFLQIKQQAQSAIRQRVQATLEKRWEPYGHTTILFFKGH